MAFRVQTTMLLCVLVHQGWDEQATAEGTQSLFLSHLTEAYHTNLVQGD